MHRIRVPLVLLVATLLIAACAAQTTNPGATRPMRMGGVCSGTPAPADADAPIVCVDDSANELAVNPNRFVLHSTPRKGNGRPAVQWFTTSGGGELKVNFHDDRCVRNVVCTGSHCTAVAARLEPGEKERVCKYDVELTGHPDLDPEGVLTPCCVPIGGGG